MKNLLLLLVLVCGLAAGYFVGDYRGKEARLALEKAIETGRTVEREREAALLALKKELDEINTKYRHDLDASRQDYAARSAEWERAKAGLDETIRRQSDKLAAANRNIEQLTSRLGASSGPERERLEQEIARLRKQSAELQRELEGNRCLKTAVPRSVLEALDQAMEKGAPR